MRRSLGPLVLLAILALPALVAPIVSWHPAPGEVVETVQGASFDHYYGPFDGDQIVTEPTLQVLHSEPGMALQDSATPGRLILSRVYSVSFAADAQPGSEIGKADELLLVTQTQTLASSVEPAEEGDNVAAETPLPFHALLVLEAQRTIVAVGLSVHPGISSAMTRLDAVPVPPMSTIQAAAFTTSSDAIPGWLLQVAWILLLVAIGLALRPWILTGAVALFSRFNQGDILDHERRHRLFSAIQADPGATFGELCQRAQLAAGVAQHHLRLLEQHELVRRTRDGRATRFYPQGRRFEPPALRNATRQRLVDLVRQDPTIDTKQLAQQLGQRPQSTWHHLHVLKKAGVLAPSRHGRLIRWNVLTR